MSVLKVKNGNQWDIVPAIKGDPGDPAADESITDDMLVTDGIKTEIEWLWGNQLTDSREGELLHAEDAYSAPAVDISVDGKSTQASYTGLNLWDEEWEVGGYSATSGNVWNTTDRIRSKAENYIPVLPSTTYFHRCSAVNTCCFYDESKSFISSSNAIPNATFTTPANAAYMRFAVFPAYGTTYKHDICLNVSGPMDGTYEPYTGSKPSPNPDYPQEIESIDDLELYQLGNKENFYAAFEWLDGYYATNGDIVASSNSMYEADYIPVSPGDILTYLYKAPTRTAAWMRFQIYDSEKTRIRATTAEISARNVEPEKLYILKRSISQSQAAYIRISINAYQDSSKPFMHVLTLQSTAPSLLPDGYSLRSLPDGTKDELHLSYLRPSTREGWAWYSRELVQRVLRVTASELAASTHWIKSSSALNGYFVGVDYFGGVRGTKAILCNMFIMASSSSDYYNNYGRMLVDSSFNFNVDPTLAGSTIADFKTWLATSGLELISLLKTPTTETLDPIELPIMPSQTVNVWSDPATNLKMTYIQDSNLIIENLEATIADIAMS